MLIHLGAYSEEVYNMLKLVRETEAEDIEVRRMPDNEVCIFCFFPRDMNSIIKEIHKTFRRTTGEWNANVLCKMLGEDIGMDKIYAPMQASLDPIEYAVVAEDGTVKFSRQPEIPDENAVAQLLDQTMQRMRGQPLDPIKSSAIESLENEIKSIREEYDGKIAKLQKEKDRKTEHIEDKIRKLRGEER